MANNNVAEASIVLSVDASKLNAGMKNAANKAKDQGSEVAKKFSATGSEATGNLFGGSSIAGMTAKAGVVGLLTGAAVAAGKAFYNSQVQTDAFGRGLEQNSRIIGRWAEASELRFTRIKERIAEFQDVAGSQTGIRVFTEELGKGEQQVRELAQQLKVAEKELATWDSTQNTEKTWSSWFNSNYESQKTASKAATEQFRAEYDSKRQAVDELRRTLDKLKDPFSNPEARSSLRQFITSQKDAVKDLYRTPEDKALEGLQRKFGFKDEDLWVARWTADLQRALTATKELKDYVQELSYEVEDFGQVLKRTSDDAKIDELIKHGAYEDDINKLKDFVKLKKELALVDSQTYQPLNGVVKGSKEEVAAQGKRDFEQKRKEEQLKIQNLLRQQLEVLKKIERQTAIDNDEF